MLFRGFRRLADVNASACVSVRLFGSSPRAGAKALPPRRLVDETEITEVFLKGSGPGGQKINKTSSAVQLKHIPTGVVVKCQETRSRDQNRKLARQILGERLDEIEKGNESRTAIKAERARSKKASAAKKSARKYRKLAEEKAAASQSEEHEDDEADGIEPEVTADVDKSSNRQDRGT